MAQKASESVLNGECEPAQTPCPTALNQKPVASPRAAKTHNVHILALDATRKGGSGVYTSQLIHALASRGHRITLVCHEASDEIKALSTVHEISRPKSDLPCGMWRIAAMLLTRSYRSSLSKLNLSHPDIVIASVQPMTLAYHDLIPEVPIVYLPHSLVAPVELASYDYGTSLQRRITVATYKRMEKKCLRIAARTIRFTEIATQAFQEYYGQAVCGRIVVLPMPIDIPAASAKPPHAETAVIRLLTVGRLIKSKNILFLLKTLADLKVEPWRLDIVGDGIERSELERFAIDAGIASRVKFHGHVDDPQSFYQAADMFVFPSVLESFGLVLLEAMGHGLTTLAFHPDGKSFLTASNEFITHGVDGLLAKDKSDFGLLLAKGLRREIPISRIGETARQTVLLRHSWNEHLLKLDDQLDSLVMQR